MASTKNLSLIDSARDRIDEGQYNQKSIRLGDVDFHLFGRKENGIGLPEIERSLLKMWPLLAEYFKAKPNEIAIIDLDAPLGGGPLSPFVVGVFYSHTVREEHQILIQQSTGWSANNSTYNYISQYYSDFAQPLRAYVDDMLVHELGHLFFGWGLTKVEPEQQNNWWFAFGMGLLYDRMAWDQIYSSPSPLFSQIIAKWKNEFAGHRSIDQRLINPDTNRDAEFGLQRLQTYGHGKAYEFLRTLRERIGSEPFDATMNKFVGANKVANYDCFLSEFEQNEKSVLSEVEKIFQVR